MNIKYNGKGKEFVVTANLKEYNLFKEVHRLMQDRFSTHTAVMLTGYEGLVSDEITFYIHIRENMVERGNLSDIKAVIMDAYKTFKANSLATKLTDKEAQDKYNELKNSRSLYIIVSNAKFILECVASGKQYNSQVRTLVTYYKHLLEDAPAEMLEDAKVWIRDIEHYIPTATLIEMGFTVVRKRPAHRRTKNIERAMKIYRNYYALSVA